MKQNIHKVFDSRLFVTLNSTCTLQVDTVAAGREGSILLSQSAMIAGIFCHRTPNQSDSQTQDWQQLPWQKLRRKIPRYSLSHSRKHQVSKARAPRL